MSTKIILMTAIIAALATPALAAPRTHSSTTALAAQRHSPNPAWDVYVGGKYVGSDPDRMIRHELRREGPADE